MSGITRVVLYKHGVGYFERVEEVDGDAVVRLSFRSSEMNDVLKSLTVQDLDGGTVQSVSYDTQEPAARRLEELALDLPQHGGAAALLARLRGARVEVEAGSRRFQGQVVGVERVARSAGGAVEKRALLTLLQEGAMQTVDLAEVTGLTFLDETLRKDLAFYFDTLLHSYRRDAKNVTLYANGAGRRRVEISYIVEAPVWKTSYRVLLDDPPFMQGWALVDNTQDEDWQDVRLSLVAGLPISFRHDLYSPRYIRRREVVVEREAAAGPVMAESAVYQAFAEEAPMAAPMPAAMRAMASGPARRDRAEAMKAMAPQTVTQSLGDLFEYSIAHPVTVQRNQSALVPILASEFEGRRVVLYNFAERAENPFAALELKNTTGLTLEGGPLVVSDGDTYAGEAMLDTLKPDESRIVPYAVDLGVQVESEHDQTSEEVSYVRARRGRLELRRARIDKRVYRFRSKDDRPRTCILEHPLQPDRKLWDTPAPRETTHSFHRFEVPLAPRAVTEFRVQERSRQSEYVEIRALPERTLALYLSRGYVPAGQEAQFREVSALMASLARLQGKRQETERKMTALTAGQERLRKNLQSLGASTDEARLRTRYVGKLEAEETELETLANLMRDLDTEIAEVEAQVEKALDRLDFEVVLRGE